MCETTLSFKIPRSRRDYTQDLQVLVNAVANLPECSVHIQASGESFSGNVEGRCTAVFDDNGRIIHGRCLARGFRVNGIYVPDGQSCSKIK